LAIEQSAARDRLIYLIASRLIAARSRRPAATQVHAAATFAIASRDNL
jgi:hypothetical protein